MLDTPYPECYWKILAHGHQRILAEKLYAMLSLLLDH